MFSTLFHKKCLHMLMYVLLHLSVINVHAFDCSWTGVGSDNLASNPANWTNCNNNSPQNSDNVQFTSTSLNCEWDISPTVQLSSFTMDTGYLGTLSLLEDLNVGTGGISITGGIFNAGSKDIELAGNWYYFDGTSNPLGDMDGDGDVDALDVSEIYEMVKGTSPLLFCSDMNFDSNTDVQDVILALRTSNSLESVRECAGGKFSPGQSTVRLTGGDQIISGDTTFYNLEKIMSCPNNYKLTFEAGSFQTILGRLTLTGDAGCLLTLESDNPGSSWYIDPQGTRNISYVNVYDLYNLSPVRIVVTNSDPDTSDRNEGLDFGGSLCVCKDKPLLLACSVCDYRRKPW